MSHYEKKKRRERAKEIETDILGELHMKTEAEIREECLPVKKCQGHQQPPEVGERHGTVASEHPEGTNHTGSLILDLQPPDL